MKKPDPFNPKICGAKELYNKANKQILIDSHLGYKWSRIRRSYISQHPFCERCGLMGECVHHIIPRSKSPQLTYEWSNLMTLCNDCHYQEHRMGHPNSYEVGQSPIEKEERDADYDKLLQLRSKDRNRD
jgi:5-methylcytosine-specific restriction endonuclease McrA